MNTSFFRELASDGLSHYFRLGVVFRCPGVLFSYALNLISSHEVSFKYNVTPDPRSSLSLPPDRGIDYVLRS